MCGFVGYAGPRALEVRATILQGAKLLEHRGPDSSGDWTSPTADVVLAHRRLAIIDLTPGGAQPKSTPDGALTVAFNGEIYNFRDLREELSDTGHRFETSSDTEVLLAAWREWGPESLGRLEGQFAFALHDRGAARLILARDRAGEKPLFYRLQGGELRFGSELKALLADRSLPRRIDPSALDCYLAMGFVPGGGCILEGYSKLPPAHLMTFAIESGDVSLRRYWSPPDWTDTGASDDELVEELDRRLEAAVVRQLVADVPVGVLLSGGVDSSLVTAMAARGGGQVTTFTVAFPGSKPEFDESAHARRVADHFGTRHVELEATPASADLLPRLAYQFDEPMADSSMIPTYLVSRLVRDHCTVALGGDGGDELFGGYPHYSRLLRAARLLGRVPRCLRAPLAELVPRMIPAGTRGRGWTSVFAADFDAEVPPVQWHFGAVDRDRLLRGRGFPRTAERVHTARQVREGDLLQRAARFDFENYLADDLLVKVDRASMLTSLEVRAPFLDSGVVEFAFGTVPSRLRATESGRKILLKRLCDRVLPADFEADRKQGFSIPLADWLAGGPWASLTEEVLLDSGSLFDRAAVESLLAGQRRGRANSERIFNLTLFELWRGAHDATL